MIWTAIASGIILIALSTKQFAAPHLFIGFIFTALFLIVSFVKPIYKWVLITGGLLWVLLTFGLMENHQGVASYFIIAAAAGSLMTLFILALIARNIRQTGSVTEQVIWAIAGSAFPLWAIASWGPDLPGQVPQAWLFLGASILIAATIEWLWRRGERSDWPLSLLAAGAGLALFGFAANQFDNLGRLITYLVAILLCAGIFNKRPVSRFADWRSDLRGTDRAPYFNRHSFGESRRTTDFRQRSLDLYSTASPGLCARRLAFGAGPR